MPVKKDASGRRYVQAEVEVPGTPEQVWKAIATGPGISSWFVPSRIEEKNGGKIIANFGPGMDSEATITSWNPPHQFTADSNDMGPNSPSIATEWTVEARAGGTCVVRVVHSWFASTDDWDNQFEGTQHGWVAFFRILRAYLTHFRGQKCSAFQLMGTATDPAAADWNALIGSLGLSNAAPGARVETGADAPRLAGVVESVGVPDHPELLVRAGAPAPGILHMFSMPMGPMTIVSVRAFLYGPAGEAAAPAMEQEWRAWINRRLPS